MNTLGILRERYEKARSRYAILNGISVHYTDDSARDADAPTIVLVHGSFLDLESYALWMGPFDSYRVVRYDRLRWGLTGHADKATITYNDEEALLEALINHLALTRFALAGSLSGGMVAAMYAACHPERITSLVLCNFPLGHARINNASGSRRNRPPVVVIRDLSMANFADTALVSDAMVTRYADFLNRADPSGAIGSGYAHAALLGETKRARFLGEIKAPTLVMWSRHNLTLALENGFAAFDKLAAPNKQFPIIESAGHMLPLEQGDASGRAARRFVDQEMSPPTGLRSPHAIG
jgi:pimeloyl-ACP methyl ester carboxylesterase